MATNIRPSPEFLRRLERECRAECQQFVDEMVRVQAGSIRPMTVVLGSDVIEYGPYPAETQAYLNRLQGMIDAIVQRYKERGERGE